MNLARHSIRPTRPVDIFDTRFDADCNIFTTTTPAGFAIYQSWPLKLLRKREITGGTLEAVLPLHTSSLLFLVGGGRSPRYPPNKVICWDDAIGKEVAELEFRERVRGIACRRGWLAVALRRRVVVFQLAATITRHAQWDTCDNPRGLLALATGAFSTLLAIPGKQIGHVQLYHLPPCSPPIPRGPPSSSPPASPPPPPQRHPVQFIAAHESELATLAVPPSGRLLATTSHKGTLIRVWDAHTGKLIRELRRGADQAEIYGVAFRPDERELCVWSDKGTVHVFALVTGSGPSNRQSTFSPLTSFIPLPKYFDSEWSYAQYRLPMQSAHISMNAPGPRPATADVTEEERCVVGWVQVPSGPSNVEYQLIALTYAGGWYRVSLPNSGPIPRDAAAQRRAASPIPASPTSAKLVRLRARSGSGSSYGGGDKGKGKEREKESRECVLQEFRRYGRWDGWG